MDERFRIIRQIFNTFVYRLIGTIIASTRVFIIAKNFSTFEAGVYAQILRVITIGLYAFGFSIHNYMIRLVPGKKEEIKLTLYKTLLLLEVFIALIIIAAIVLLNGDNYFCKIVKISPYQNILRLGLFIVIVQIIAMGFMRFYSAIKEIEFSNFIDFFNSRIWIIFLLVLWGIGVRITLTIFFLSWIGGAFITIILGLKKMGVSRIIKTKFDFSITGKAFLFSSPLLLANLGSEIVNSSSEFILSHYHTASATGLYFVSYRPLTMIYEFVASVGLTVFVPYIIEAHNLNDTGKKSFYFSIMTKYTLIAAIPLVLGILIGRVDLIKFISKPEFWKAESIVPFIALMPLIYIFIYPAHYTLFLENRTVLIGIIYFTVGLFNVGLNILLIPNYEYYGAASATIISLILVFIIFYFLTYKSLHLRWNFIKIGKILFVTIISGIISTIIYRYFDDFSVEFVRLILLGVLILTIYLPLLYLLNVFESREIASLKQLANKYLKK